MRRIKSGTTTGTLPADTATGTVGYFQKGDAIGGVEATHLTAEWCNSVQNELYNAAVEFGDAEDVADNQQVIRAAKNSVQPSYIMNGNFRLLRKSTSSFPSIADNIYFAQRWKYNKNGAVVNDVTLSASTVNQLSTYRRITGQVSVATTTDMASPSAGNYAYLVQHIESKFFVDIGQGAFTYNFWVKSSKTGTFCVAFSNKGTGTLPNNTPDRCYIATYTITAANTWQRIVIKVPARDNTGTWDYVGSGLGLSVKHVLAAGTTYNAPSANTWVTGNYLSHSSAGNLVDNVANTLEITGCWLDRGATDSHYRENGVALLDLECRRYYQTNFNNATTASIDSGTIDTTSGVTYKQRTSFKTPMRTAPTITLTNRINTAAFPSTGTVSDISAAMGFTEERTATATATGQQFASGFEADAEIYGV